MLDATADVSLAIVLAVDGTILATVPVSSEDHPLDFMPLVDGWAAWLKHSSLTMDRDAIADRVVAAGTISPILILASVGFVFAFNLGILYILEAFYR